jgi:hypothetical protein
MVMIVFVEKKGLCLKEWREYKKTLKMGERLGF